MTLIICIHVFGNIGDNFYAVVSTTGILQFEIRWATSLQEGGFISVVIVRINSLSILREYVLLLVELIEEQCDEIGALAVVCW